MSGRGLFCRKTLVAGETEKSQGFTGGRDNETRGDTASRASRLTELVRRLRRMPRADRDLRVQAAEKSRRRRFGVFQQNRPQAVVDLVPKAVGQNQLRRQSDDCFVCSRDRSR